MALTGPFELQPDDVGDEATHNGNEGPGLPPAGAPGPSSDLTVMLPQPTIRGDGETNVCRAAPCRCQACQAVYHAGRLAQLNGQSGLRRAGLLGCHLRLCAVAWGVTQRLRDRNSKEEDRSLQATSPVCLKVATAPPEVGTMEPLQASQR